MFKKAQGMSINTVIIAILALMVLVALALLFAWKMGWIFTGFGECTNNGGTCYPGTSCVNSVDTTQKTNPVGGAACFKSGTKVVDTQQVCCSAGSIGQ